MSKLTKFRNAKSLSAFAIVSASEYTLNVNNNHKWGYFYILWHNLGLRSNSPAAGVEFANAVRTQKKVEKNWTHKYNCNPPFGVLLGSFWYRRD